MLLKNKRQPSNSQQENANPVNYMSNKTPLIEWVTYHEFELLCEQARARRTPLDRMLFYVMFPMSLHLMAQFVYLPYIKGSSFLNQLGVQNVNDLFHLATQEFELAKGILEQFNTKNKDLTVAFLAEACSKIDNMFFLRLAAYAQWDRFRGFPFPPGIQRFSASLQVFCNHKETIAKKNKLLASHLALLYDVAFVNGAETESTIRHGQEYAHGYLKLLYRNHIVRFMNMVYISAIGMHFIPSFLLQKSFIKPYLSPKLSAIFFKEEIEIQSLVSAGVPQYQQEAEENLERLRFLLSQYKKKIQKIDLIKNVLISIFFLMAIFYMFFSKGERSISELEKLDLGSSGNTLDFIVMSYMLYGSATLLAIEGAMKAHDWKTKRSHTKTTAELYTALQKIIKLFNQSQLKNRSDYLLFSPKPYFFEGKKEQKFSAKAVSKVFKAALLRNDVSIVEGGVRIIIPTNQVLSPQKVENIARTLRELFHLQVERRKEYVPLCKKMAALGWERLEGAEQASISNLLNKKLECSPNVHHVPPRKTESLNKKKRVNFTRIENAQKDTHDDVVQTISWGNRTYDPTRLPKNIVELKAPWLPGKRHYAEFECTAEQFENNTQQGQFFLIFGRGIIVPPKGAQGFVPSDTYVREFGTKQWRHSDLKLKSPNKDGRAYCTEHLVNEEGQVLHKVTTFIKKTH